MRVLTLATAVLLAATALVTTADDQSPAQAGVGVSVGASGDRSADRSGAASARRGPSASAATTQVLAISVDGLNPAAIRRLGRARAPHLTRLMREGASTTEARTQFENTNTLPNHTSMVTGRRVWGWRGGHGILWNDHRPGSKVEDYAEDRPVASVFTVARRAGSTAVFTSKEKLSLFKRSWPRSIDRFVVRDEDDARMTQAAVSDLRRHLRAFRLVHFSRPDSRGHTYGFMSPRYLDGVAEVDAQLGRLLAVVERRRSLADTIVVLTADHGGGHGSTRHRQIGRRVNYRIPFVVWGRGVRAGDLYRMNRRSYRAPGRSRPNLSGRQPIRTGDVANLSLDLLGLGPVPGSRFGKRQNLRWR